MPVRVTLDVMLARRKVRARDVAEHFGQELERHLRHRVVHFERRFQKCRRNVRRRGLFPPNRDITLEVASSETQPRQHVGRRPNPPVAAKRPSDFERIHAHNVGEPRHFTRKTYRNRHVGVGRMFHHLGVREAHDVLGTVNGLVEVHHPPAGFFVVVPKHDVVGLEKEFDRRSQPQELRLVNQTQAAIN